MCQKSTTVRRYKASSAIASQPLSHTPGYRRDIEYIDLRRTGTLKYLARHRRTTIAGWPKTRVHRYVHRGARRGQYTWAGMTT